MPQNHPTTDTTTLEAESAATENSAAPQTKPRRARKKAAAVPAPADLDVTTADEPAVPKTPRRTRKAASKQTADPAPEPVGSPTVPSAASLLFQAPEFVAVEPVEPVADPATVPAPAGEPGDDETPRRRRRRGGRGRRKKGAGEPGEAAEPAGDDDTGQPTSQPAVETPSSAATGQDDIGAADAAAGKDEVDDDAADGEETAAASRRRRRRRRRKGEPDTTELAPDDPADTVVRIREPRPNNADEVTSLKGSTRLEAKKQRRREGREAGRRRPPVISEAEFLARREAVDRVMVVRQTGDRIQIGVLEDGVLVEHYVSRSTQQSMVGNVYLGRVQNVLPAMEAAFVDIGRGRNAIIYAGEVDWAGLGKPDGPRRIEEVLKSGQSVLVQVTKDPVGHKGARLTGQISLAGRYVVYVPAGSMSGISRKLPENERARLKKILQQVVPDDSAVIVRTAAEGASEEELTHDVARLRAQWDDIAKKSSGNAPQLLYSEPDLAIKVVRDLFNEDFAKLVVSGDEAWDTIEAYVSYVASSLRDRLERWSGDGDVFAAYRIDEQIAKALERKVWLPSGGSLVIDRTEAMTVVDVNTGKFTGSGGNLEETVTKNNLEAAEEVVRQLRLRDIGGIIVIDFIDMVLEANRDLVLRRLVECLGRDRTKHQVAEVTSLGLVQMTRKRIGTDLLEAFSEPCEQCNGRGLHIHLEPVEPTAKPAEVGSDGAGRSGRGRRVARAAAEPVAAEEEGVTEEMTPEPGLISAVEADEFDDLEPLSADDVPSGDGSAEPVGEATTVPVPETPPASAPAPRRSRRRAVRPAGEPDAPAEPAVREEIDADAEPATV
jgi:ribonuclease E